MSLATLDTIPPLGKANAAGGWLLVPPNEMRRRFGGGRSKPLPYRGYVKLHPMPCNERNAAAFRRRHQGTALRRICIICRATNDIPNCFNGSPRASTPTENPQIVSNAVQRTKCGGVSTAAPRHRPTTFALNRIKFRAKTDGYNIRPYRDKI